ncbi:MULTISPECIES: DUF1090 family protein [unclassified Shewanella]|uniref:DUF1090 family protein n=1 Tax=unclassified Shewanella TaxID=196818 RepID=UPI001BC019C9|nr:MULTISPECIES: DUF1090 family protein [unclassified Shewanella]GIU15852.1 hypothetical protein TUM4444_27750 [Shewanella sp. MBTL60-112-B1]GIU39486.1 hypothetical protein TUM4445_36040 [Shewanella sp. MBTL60-112-B2]
MKNKTSRVLIGLTMSCSVLTLGIGYAQAASAADCSKLAGCAQKSCKVEALIADAKAKGHDQMVMQLQSSLKHVNTNCTDEGIKNDLQTEIAGVELQLESDKADLKAAKAANELDKSYHYAQKVLAEKYKLEQLKQELAKMK